MKDKVENGMKVPLGSPELNSGKETSEVALGLHPPNQLDSPGCAQLCPGALWGFYFLQGVMDHQGMPVGRKHLFHSAGWPNGQATPETHTALWCLEQANRKSTKKQKPASEMSCSGFLEVSKASHVIRPPRRATHSSLQRKSQTVTEMMSPWGAAHKG